MIFIRIVVTKEYLIIIKYMLIICTGTNVSRVPTVRDKSNPIIAGF